MFVIVMCFLVVCPRTIRRYLHRLGYSLVRAVPFIASPDPNYWRKVKKLVSLKRRAREGKIILLYEDELDLNLLPGVMRCWIKRGSQRKVLTLGKNVKRHGFGAVDYITGAIVFQTSEHKDSANFCALAKAILNRYIGASRRIVVVLNTYIIHASKITQSCLAGMRDRLSLFFLPTYSPHLNYIELLWKHLRRTVTYNHLFEGIAALVEAVDQFIDKMNRSPQQVLSVIGASQ